MATTSTQQWPVVFQSFHIHKISFNHLGIIAMLLSHSAQCSLEASHVWIVAVLVAGHCVARILLTGFRCFFFTIFLAIVHSVFLCVCVSQRYFKRFQSFITTTLHWTAEKWKLAKRAAITMDGKPNQMHINWLLHAHTLPVGQFGFPSFSSFCFLILSLVCAAMQWSEL